MGMEKFMSEKWCENFKLESLEGRKATFVKKPRMVLSLLGSG